ncbi:hypothetical protein, partial [Gordonia aichiensis]|uniref:hypothetical protein n=1 Tax=Gordonia aichiensis TaxID=36820 RepID=UPI0012FB6F5F
MPDCGWIANSDPTPIACAIDWLQGDSEWALRAFLIPQKRWQDTLLDAYASNGNVGSDRAKRATGGGPVFCYGPTLTLLEQATSISTDGRG